MIFRFVALAGRQLQSQAASISSSSSCTRGANYNATANGQAWTWPAHQARSQFIYHDYHAEFDDGLAQLAAWVKDGKIRYREDVVDGFEKAPSALICLLAGGNIGKRIVRVGPNPEGIA